MKPETTKQHRPRLVRARVSGSAWSWAMEWEGNYTFLGGYRPSIDRHVEEQAHELSGGLIEEALTGWYGERCDDYSEGCACCEAWKKLDELKTE